MKKEKELSIEDESYCANCEHAAALHGEDYVLCERNGVVRATYVCRKFSYDPLKRRPGALKAPKLEYVDLDG